MIAAIGVVAHHRRYERATRLGDWLRADIVAVDEGGLGAGPNHEVAYRWLADTGAPWSVLIEDDAIPIQGFHEQLPRILKSSPTDVLSLYLGRTRPPHWQPSIAQVVGDDHHFLTASELLHHVAVAVRTEIIPDLLGHLQDSVAYQIGKLPIDEAVGQFCRDTGRLVGYSFPSPVDHDGTLPTVISTHVSRHPREPGTRRGEPPRRAWAFGSRKIWDGSRRRAIPEPS